MWSKAHLALQTPSILLFKLSRGVTPAGGTQRYYITGGLGEKTRKVGVKRKWRVLAQPPYFSRGNESQSPRVEPLNQGDRAPDVEENPGSWCCQRLGGQVRYIHIKQE